MLRFRNSKGLGLIEILIFLLVISVTFSVSIKYLGKNYDQRAFLRSNFLTKKSFGGAEIIMIDQQQCRCNFLSQLPQVAANIARDTQIEIDRFKSYRDTINCNDSADDVVLSDTNAATALRENRASKIMLTNWSIVIPQMLYRARVFISPTFGRPVSFPVLFSGRTTGAQFNIEICGVDRAS